MLVADVAFVSLVLMDRDLPLVLHVCGVCGCVCGVWCVWCVVCVCVVCVGVVCEGVGGGAGLRAATVGNIA